MVKRWKELGFDVVHEGIGFDLCMRTLENPANGYTDKFYFIRCCDWVNVIPITPDGEVVLIRQWRHGIDAVSLEIPGGMLDSDEEDPSQGALRELAEETGYTSSKLISLGSINPNPAIQGNRCHFFAAFDAVKNGAQNLDPAEDIEIVTHPLADIEALVDSGEICHALPVLCIYRFLASDAGKSLLQKK